MVSIVGKSIQSGMSFSSSHDSDDDTCSDHGNPSENENETLDDIDGDSSTNFVFAQPHVWEIKKVNTVWIGGLLIVITIALMHVAAVVVTVECRGGPNKSNGTNHGALCDVPSVSLIMYLQSILWGLFMICDQFIQYEHSKARRRGYLEFYNETRTLSQIPFCIVSAWCALLLAVTTVLHDNCETDENCGKKVHLGKAEYALVVVGLEGILIIIFASIYIFKVYKFNRCQALPDVLKDEFMSAATDFSPNSHGQIDEEVFQRQADAIRYLSEHNAILRRKVLELSRPIIVTTEHSQSV